MYYCFVKEDLEYLNVDDPLMIQVQYAKNLGCFCCCSLSEQNIIDQEMREIDCTQQRFFLRATCDSMYEAMNIIEMRGGELLETLSDIHKIENWSERGISIRPIFSLEVEKILQNCLDGDVREFLKNTPLVFMKTKEKGFTVKLPSAMLLNRDEALMKLIEKYCWKGTGILLLSELFGVKKDSIGRKEVRNFVFDGEIVNSSRPVRSIKHIIFPSLLAASVAFVEKIASLPDFPVNYVLDVGQFERNGETFFDIVELNPITSSTAYVNNSIFETDLSHSGMMKTKSGMGMEYCYDAIAHPNRYLETRYSGVSYEYCSPEHFDFTTNGFQY